MYGTGKIPKRLARIYNDLFERRQEGDFIDFVNFGESQVVPWISKAEFFYNTAGSNKYKQLAMEAKSRRMKIIDNLQPGLNTAEIQKRLHLDADSREWQDVEAMADQAAALIRPKCAYKACYIQQKEEDAVIVEGVRLESRVLRKNLEAAQRVFPFVVTIGAEIEEAARARDDYLEQYYMDTIANVALQDAIQGLRARLQDQYAIDKLSYMNVGSLEDWPLAQQRPLFSLLGDVEGAIGVRLSPSMLMHPGKTESGIFFPTEVTFFNCQLCPRKGCPSRKADFDGEMAREYGVSTD